MQKTLMASLIGLAVCTGNAFSPALAAEAKQRNLVIIMADDLGYGDLQQHMVIRSLKHLISTGLPRKGSNLLTTMPPLL